MPRYRSYGGTGGRASLAAAESWQKARFIVDDDREGSFTSTRSNTDFPLLPFVVEEQVNIRFLSRPARGRAEQGEVLDAELRYSHAGGGTSTTRGEETIDVSHAQRNQTHPSRPTGKST